jgi:putative transposase
VFLSALSEALETHQCALHAYVLMTNHVHLLITPRGDVGLGGAMQAPGRRYVGHVNRRYARTGTLWEGRGPRRQSSTRIVMSWPAIAT